MLLFLLPGSLVAQRITSRIVGISDGDTMTFLTVDRRQVKVRLDGIDSPEKAQPYGAKARQYASSLLYGKTVTFTPKD